MSIGSKIKDLCADNDITQRQLAIRIGLSKDALYRYTHDVCYPNAEVLHNIAVYFGISMDSFWDD